MFRSTEQFRINYNDLNTLNDTFFGFSYETNYNENNELESIILNPKGVITFKSNISENIFNSITLFQNNVDNIIIIYFIDTLHFSICNCSNNDIIINNNYLLYST